MGLNAHRARVWPFAVLLLAACTGDDRRPTGMDGGVGLLEMGEPCDATEDCASGLCLEVDAFGGAICTEACESRRDCPGGPSWACVAPASFAGRVCGCARTGSLEICGDGLDNDCDGATDDCRICFGVAVAENDPSHCGECGNACRFDQICRDGSCVCGLAGTVECDGACVDLGSSPLHCGTCGTECGDERACVDGACACTDVTTPTWCGTIGCVDTSTDARACGECGTSCPPALRCNSGACTCPGAGDEYCGASAGCVDTETHELHCGGCGAPCPSGEICTGGACGCAPEWPIRCGTACVDTQDDPANCGMCGTACGAGLVCRAGACECPSFGFTSCSGTCVDTRTDPSNCGGCGVACAPGETCGAGGCACASGLYCGGVCVSSTDPANCGTCGNTCGPTQYCTGGTCWCSSSGFSPCGTECLYLSTDPANCGACGNACRPGESCAGSICRCPTGQTWCAEAGTCVSLSSDTSHCGTCGNTCDPTEVCSGGTCQCPLFGQMWCASVGACVDTRSSSSHCGGCNVVCPPATTCTSGSCRCTDTSLVLCGTSCVDTQADESNCGACGTTCAGVMTCAAGACMCPAPTPGTQRRLTMTMWGDNYLDLASSGTNSAIVYSSGAGGVVFQLLDTASRPIAGTMRQLDVNAVANAQVVWTGSRYTVVFVDRPIVGSTTRHLMLQHFDIDGTPIGAVVDITAVSGVSSPLGMYANIELAYTTASGYAITGYDWFQYLGLDGTTPEVAYTFPNRSYPELAGSPTGRWGVVVLRETTLFQFYDFNADGSLTRPAISLPRLTSSRAIDEFSLVHDGVTWVLGYAEHERVGTSGYSRVRIRRGDNLEMLWTVHQLVDTWSPLTEWLDTIFLDVRANELLVSWPEDTPGVTEVGSKLMTRRASISPTPTGPVTPITAPVNLVTPPTLIGAPSHQGLYVSANRLIWAWEDARWGYSEIYTMATTFVVCP